MLEAFDVVNLVIGIMCINWAITDLGCRVYSRSKSKRWDVYAILFTFSIGILNLAMLAT
jgi:hypothetical protein